MRRQPYARRPRPRPVPTSRQRTWIGIAVVVIAVDALVNVFVLDRGFLAVVQLALAAWLAWRVFWVPRRNG